MGATVVTGGAALFTAVGGLSGFGRPKPPPGTSGKTSGPTPGRAGWTPGAPPVTVGVSGPPPAGPPPAAGKASGPPCAAAGIARVRPPSSRRKNVRPRCHCRNARAAVKLRGLTRAQHITLTTLRIIIILVGAKMFACRRIALIEEKADPGAAAEHAQACFDFHLLCVMRLDDEDNLSDQRSERRGIAARHARRSINNDIAVGKLTRHFGHQDSHFVA